MDLVHAHLLCRKYQMILYHTGDEPLIAISYDTALLASLTDFLLEENLTLQQQTPEEFLSVSQPLGYFLNLVQHDMDLREKISHELDHRQAQRFSLVHDSCHVVSPTSIAPGVFVWPNCGIGTGVSIGRDVIICPHSYIGHYSSIAMGSYIAPGVTICGSVRIGKFCKIGVGSVVVDKIEICDYVQTGVGTIVRRGIGEPGVYVNENQLTKLQ